MSFTLDFEFLVSNKVKIENLEGLKESLRPFDMDVITDEDGYSRLKIDQYIPRQSLDDETVEFSYPVHVMPYVAKNEVLIVKSGSVSYDPNASGNPFWLGAVVKAHVRNDEGVFSKTICLEDIYKGLAEELNIDPRTPINKAEREN